MGAFDKDKEFGNRLDLAFKMREPFVLLGVDYTGEIVKTTTRDAEQCDLIVARLASDPDVGFRVDGEPFVANTIAQAIVDKLRDLTDDELPAVVELRRVPSKRSKTGEALVVQYVGSYTGPEIDTSRVR